MKGTAIWRYINGFIIITLLFLLLLQGGRWISYHIDDLHPENTRNQLPMLSSLERKSLAELYEEALQILDIQLESDITNAAQNSDDLQWQGEEDADSMDSNDSTAYRSEVVPEVGGMVQEVPGRMESGDLCTVHSDLSENILNEDSILTKQLTQVHRLPAPLITCLDVDNLVHRCIHKSAAMLMDYEADTGRKTERVPILLDLLSRKRGNNIIDI